MRTTLFILILAALLSFSCSKPNTSAADEAVAAPEISPEGGSYDTLIPVYIYCATYDATIHYSTDGSEPTQDSPVYDGLIQINSNTTIKARAFKKGYIPSPITIESYEFSSAAVQPVIITPAGGVFQEPNKITLSCATPGAEIFYTLDGSEPTQASTAYFQPIMLCGSVTIKARAFAENMIPSLIASASFTMQLQAPLFSVPGGQYEQAQTLSISSPNSSAEIRYTLDGSDPDQSSMLYSNPIVVDVNRMVKARAYLEGWEPSPMVSSFYIINLANQMQLVEAGNFHNGTANVQISSFYIAKREVTELEWVYIMLDMDSITPDLPKTELAWVDAIEYCNYRSIAEGFEPCYSYGDSGTIPAFWPEQWQADHTQIHCNWDANGYRLPTEMEWMYAASGGNLSQDYIYSGSDNIDMVAWYSGNTSAPQSVGTMLPNELGIYDMSGNVWEFCWDLFLNEYPNTDTVDYSGPDTGYLRSMRGGSFSTDAANCTVSRRFYTPVNLSADAHGFRVVRKF
ncbi:MAG: chitobiase/beta-hexosaminidase C-terminal domain-containing protein [Candidatus Cloacimonadaceae bacterium]|nr:chitobiase/beta-hexosaminidase C-terminal domain-containing protein [Candidatus Cloacimonadota bacterium]MDD4667431.1 chitobiase/beta-hexosaminidase C-terminal domain-containing protein [Candidatus Cloacimonadota bacterium]